MLYKKFAVYGVPRSGNHYLAAAIAQNFWDSKRYRQFCGGHSLGSRFLNRPDIAVFYVWRTFDDFAKSLYNLRHRFALNAPTLEDFKNTPMNKMAYRPPKGEIVSLANFRGPGITKFDKATPLPYRGTVYEYWQNHIKHWTSYKSSNLMVVSYDELRAEFAQTMLAIARFLGSDKTQFTDIQERVGFYPDGENWIRK